MGGHGGLNILPQKRWNVYNFENREKVREDEEAAAKEEQLKREQSRKRDTEFRLEKLRQGRGLASSSSQAAAAAQTELKSESKSNHINLFEGIEIFDRISRGIEGEGDDKRGKFKKLKKDVAPAPKVMLAEVEKYKLGYGLVGKGVKLPWYMLKRKNDEVNVESGEDDKGKEKSKSSGEKKTLEELREERLKRERREKERARTLLVGKGPRDGPAYKDRYFTIYYKVIY